MKRIYEQVEELRVERRTDAPPRGRPAHLDDHRGARPGAPRHRGARRPEELTMRFSVWPNPDRTFEDVLEVVRDLRAARLARRVRARTTSCRTARAPTALRGDLLEATTPARRARRAHVAHPARDARRLGHLPAPRGPRERQRRDRPDQPRPRDRRAGRGLAGERARELRHRAGLDQRADRPVRRVRGRRALDARQRADDLSGRLLPPASTRRATRARSRTTSRCSSGCKGKRRTMAIAAQYADVWNAWTTPEDLVECNARPRRALPGDRPGPRRRIARSTQALLFLSTDEPWLAPFRDNPVGRSSIVGTPAEVTEIVAAYERAGCDELIVPCWGLGDQARAPRHPRAVQPGGGPPLPGVTRRR